MVGFAVVFESAVFGSSLIERQEVSGSMKPARKVGFMGKRVCFFRQEKENLLGKIIGMECGLRDTTGGGPDQVDIAINEAAKCRLGLVLKVISEQLLIFVHVSLIVL